MLGYKGETTKANKGANKFWQKNKKSDREGRERKTKIKLKQVMSTKTALVDSWSTTWSTPQTLGITIFFLFCRPIDQEIYIL